MEGGIAWKKNRDVERRKAISLVRSLSLAAQSEIQADTTLASTGKAV